MKLTKEQLKHIIKEEYSRLIIEQKVRRISAEFGYTLSENVIKEINWNTAKGLLKKGVTGLALTAALMGIAKPAMADDPAPGECTENVCSVEIGEVDQETMKKELAELVKMMVDAGDSADQAQEMMGWQAEWGPYTTYLTSSSSIQ